MFDPHAPVDIVTLRAGDVDAIGRVIVAAFAGEVRYHAALYPA